ncbi:hypothetical protein RB195_009294 [Necator americanus]|uniref:7TM GPCR serpentine receptor class x (Srx) domain-containing protein n=1 Tax=Necator americanus TaxID=51031 RepID=A0ABR1CTY4_NECAM
MATLDLVFFQFWCIWRMSHIHVGNDSGKGNYFGAQKSAYLRQTSLFLSVLISTNYRINVLSHGLFTTFPAGKSKIYL